MKRVPRKVKAKITRTVTEIAIVTLYIDGTIDEIEDICEELEVDCIEVVSIIEVIS